MSFALFVAAEDVRKIIPTPQAPFTEKHYIQLSPIISSPKMCWRMPRRILSQYHLLLDILEAIYMIGLSGQNLKCLVNIILLQSVRNDEQAQVQIRAGRTCSKKKLFLSRWHVSFSAYYTWSQRPERKRSCTPTSLFLIISCAAKEQQVKDVQYFP